VKLLTAFVLTVCGLTAAQRAGLIPLDAIASSPHMFAKGKYWLLFTNGLVADRPTVPSLFALVLFGLIALAVCGPRLLWTAALLGHVGATVIVYESLALWRLSHPNAFSGALTVHDFGLSAICAAWLGAAAALGSARVGAGGRVAIAAVCALVGLVAWLVAIRLTVLDVDHGVAFLIGLGLGGLRLTLPFGRRTPQPV
jgi:hypothetical protein